MERKHNSAAKLSLFVSFLFVLQFGWILAETVKRSTTARAEKATGKLSAWGKSMDLVDLREYIL